MSLNNPLKYLGVVQEALVLGLMIVAMLTLLYLDIDMTFKIVITVFSFAVIFLVNLASQLINQMRNNLKAK
jgi:predicted cation transporter